MTMFSSTIWDTSPQAMPMSELFTESQSLLPVPQTIGIKEEVSVRVIRKVEEIEDVRSIWCRWQKHPVADIDFYLNQECSGPSFVRPHLVLIYRDGTPDAMLVGKLLDMGVSDFTIGPWSVWKPRARVLRIPHGGLLGNATPENCEMFVKEIMASLDRGEADVATFRGFRADSSTFYFVHHLPNYLCRDPFPQTILHCSMKLPSTVEEVYPSLSKLHRRDIRRMARKVIADYGCELCIRCFKNGTEIDRMIRDIEHVAKDAWQRGRGGGFIDTEQMRKRLHLAARKEWLRGYILYIRNQPCAFAVGTLYHGTFYWDYTGYDPSYDRYSPGTFLFMRMLDDLCQQNVKLVDFGFGEEMYKQRFGNCKWQDAEMICLFANRSRGIALRVLRTVTGIVDGFGRNCLKVFHLKPRLKRAWRRHLNKGKGYCEVSPEGSTLVTR